MRATSTSMWGAPGASAKVTRVRGMTGGGAGAPGQWVAGAGAGGGSCSRGTRHGDPGRAGVASLGELARDPASGVLGLVLPELADTSGSATRSQLAPQQVRAQAKRKARLPGKSIGNCTVHQGGTGWGLRRGPRATPPRPPPARPPGSRVDPPAQLAMLRALCFGLGPLPCACPGLPWGGSPVEVRWRRYPKRTAEAMAVPRAKEPAEARIRAVRLGPAAQVFPRAEPQRGRRAAMWIRGARTSRCPSLTTNAIRSSLEQAARMAMVAIRS